METNSKLYSFTPISILPAKPYSLQTMGIQIETEEVPKTV